MSLDLDRIDLKILCLLQEDSSITNIALSERVSLSASACLTRVHKLKEAGVIKREIAVVDPTLIGPVLTSLLEITLKNHSLADHKTFESGISGIPEIVSAKKVSGRFDYLLEVTTIDMPALNALSDRLLEGTLGIEKLVTLPVLDTPKPFAGIPIERLAGQS